MSGDGVEMDVGEVDWQYDENTGQWFDPDTGEYYTGELVYDEDPEQLQYEDDPNAPPVYEGYEGWGYDPQTGAMIDPQTGAYVDPANGYNIDPETGYHIDPGTGDFIDPESGQTFTAEQAAEWAQENEEAYDYDDDERSDTGEYMDYNRQVKANQAQSRYERVSAFSGEEMKILWLQKLDARVTRKSNIMLILALIGIALMVLHIEVNYDPTTKTINGNSEFAIAMKFVIGFTTVALLCALFDYYQLQVYIWRKYEKPAGEPAPTGWPNQFLYPFIVEAIVLFLHPVPYLFRDKLGMLMFMRLYLLVRVIRDHSDIYNKRHTILNEAYKDRGGPQFNSLLVLRIVFDSQPGLCLMLFGGFLMIILGWCNYVCQRESPYVTEDITYFKAVWGTAFVIFTGDVKFEVHSNFGRAIELITLMVGVLLYAMILAVVHNKIILKSSEKFGEECITSHNRALERQRSAARLLQSWWRFERLKRKNRVSTQDMLDFQSVCTRHQRLRHRLDVQDKNSMDPILDRLLSMERQLTAVETNVSDIRITQDLMSERSTEMLEVLRHRSKTSV